MGVDDARTSRSRPGLPGGLGLWLAGGTTTLGVLLVVLVVLGVMGTISQARPPCQTDPAAVAATKASAVGASEIPGELAPIYAAAAARYELGGDGWLWLAAINRVETDFGRNLNVSSAGAVGWMQFMPATWATYGVDADGDGKKDPSDKQDAIYGAANYLHASGAPKDWAKAVYAYNHAGWYVADVKRWHDRYATNPNPATANAAPAATCADAAYPGVSSAAPGALGELTGSPQAIVNRVVAWARDHGFPSLTAASVTAANARHAQLTTSNNRSDHKGPPDQAWAADISNGISPTREMDELAAAIASAFEIPWQGSGLVSAGNAEYRIQLIYRTCDGGDHWNHVHLGIKRAPGPQPAVTQPSTPRPC